MRFARCCVALLSAAAAVWAGKYNSVVEIGSQAPGFSRLPATDGKTYSLADFRENVVVLVFLANHCPWVRGGDKDLIQLVNELQGKSVRVVGVAVNLRPDDLLPAMKEHAQKAGYNFVYLHDPTQGVGRKYGATRTPEYFVLNQERKVVYMGSLHNSPAQMLRDGTVEYTNGPPTQHYVREAVLAALAGRAAPVAETRAQGCTVEYAGR